MDRQDRSRKNACVCVESTRLEQEEGIIIIMQDAANRKQTKTNTLKKESVTITLHDMTNVTSCHVKSHYRVVVLIRPKGKIIAS